MSDQDGRSSAMARQLASIIVPAYCERNNLPVLYRRIETALADAKFDWELLIIDDHSSDDTFAIATEIAARDPRVKAFRLARNSGSNIAAASGLELAQGDCSIVMAADLQDPPELIAEMVEKWQAGDQVVWACRKPRSDVGYFSRLSSVAYYALLARLIRGNRLPPQGADFFLIDRKVGAALGECQEANLSIVAMVLWLGFRQGMVYYEKQQRRHGRSSWTFRRKVRLVVNSVVAFSDLPLRIINFLGILIACIGFAYAVYIGIAYFFTEVIVPGYASLMVALLVLSGLQMTMLGIIGEYLSRTLDESRKRPRFHIESRSPPIESRATQVRPPQ